MTPADLFERTAADMRYLAAGTAVTQWPPSGIYLDVEGTMPRTAEYIAAWSPDLAVALARFLDDVARMFGRWPADTQRSLVHPGIIALCDTWWQGRGIDPATV